MPDAPIHNFDVFWQTFADNYNSFTRKNIDWTAGGLGDASEYRIGNQFIWTPVNNLSLILEGDYMYIDQTLAHNVGSQATALPAGVSRDPSAFEGRVRMERDF